LKVRVLRVHHSQ
jgi:hypothetical protein